MTLESRRLLSVSSGRRGCNRRRFRPLKGGAQSAARVWGRDDRHELRPLARSLLFAAEPGKLERHQAARPSVSPLPSGCLMVRVHVC